MRLQLDTIRRLGAAVLIATPTVASTQQPVDTEPRVLRSGVRSYRTAHEGAIIRELVDLLAIPNVASDSVNIRKNAAHLLEMLRRRGVEARLLESEGSPPAVYGELRVPGAVRTIVMYAHYDGQPALGDPRWSSDPWTPVFRDSAGRQVSMPSPETRIDPEWRLYARSASDDKAPIVAMLAALDALRATGRLPSANIKFFFEGEEEAGSTHLRQMLERHRELLKADAWIFCDGPVHQSRSLQVVFGVRGAQDLEMTVYGPNRPLHSGHYGNWAPNPIVLLTHLLASMRSTDGRIRIKSFYDDVRPITREERRAIADAPRVDAELRRSLGLASSEAGNAPLAERVMLPALNLRGIHSGFVGEQATNAIPTQATASIDFRLVPDQTPARVRELVEAHVRRQGFFIVKATPDSTARRTHARLARLEWGSQGYPATRAPMTLPVSRAVVRVVSDALDGPVIQVPTMGGSLPTYLIAEVTKAPLIILPIVNHDNSQHAPNENLRIQNLWDGIEVFASLYARVGPAWREHPVRQGAAPDTAVMP